MQAKMVPEDLCLETLPLTLCSKKNQTETHEVSCMMKSDMVLSRTSSSSSSSALGDYIGMESCCDLEESEESSLYLSETCSSERRGERDHRCQQRCTAMKREFPPPIPLLARTGNLSSHMPWVLKRYYTSDGRLILWEEKVKHHEYFLAHRSNGRLTLQLVPLDDDVMALSYSDDEDADEETKTEVETEENGEIYIENVEIKRKEEEPMHEESTDIIIHNEQEAVKSVGDKGSTWIGTNDGRKCFLHKDHEAFLEAPMMKNEHSTADDLKVDSGSGSAGLAANGGKCLTYSKFTAKSSCFLGMPVPAIRPVHT
ncbi:hypothetical protein SLE2022_326890 [Rubroshorea leprosula]